MGVSIPLCAMRRSFADRCLLKALVADGISGIKSLNLLWCVRRRGAGGAYLMGFSLRMFGGENAAGSGLRGGICGGCYDD